MNQTAKTNRTGHGSNFYQSVDSKSTKIKNTKEFVPDFYHKKGLYKQFNNLIDLMR